ncbi:hotdog domain-containing protein [Lutibacter maritimus]|uniref:Thioesterase superfamily n=1 Tax=Lutibacter maritimus TaxID=593133 RepID=A0A1I6NQ37_9FLAO|nr:hotdog domain-containing protein [Lutibacter maritimus]SFS30007.1 Thioesterase superfamily [Lutibacter maritimus]
MDTITQNTHLKTSKKLIGNVISIEEDKAIVQLNISEEMVVDSLGLSHGGFTFGLADYAAMVLINHPNVVLGKAEVKFVKPTVVGDVLTATASYKEKINDVKTVVSVLVFNKKQEVVFEGEFVCFTLQKHVLDK